MHIRLDKFLTDLGLTTRRQAARFLKSAAVTVNGRPALSPSEKVDPETDTIEVSGAKVAYKDKHYFMMNKPAGVVSATEDRRERTVLDLLDEQARRLRLFPAGRLDKDSEGLLLLTNDGDWAHRVISPSKDVVKTYYVEVEGLLTEEDAQAFRDGITLRDGLVCRPAVLKILTAGERSAALVYIREGKYHQVRRMVAARGKHVLYLKRIAIGALKLDERLQPGRWRELTEEEVKSVFENPREI
jgi:16S rRNA pseudouridine516 synthase